MSYINLFYTRAGSSQAGSRDPTTGDRRASGNQCAAGAELMLDVYRCAWESSAAVATLLVALRRPPCADGTHMAAPCKAAAACWRVPSFSRARLHCFTIHSMEAEGGDKHLYQASALHSLATCHRSKAAPAGALAPLDCASCLAAFDPYRSLSRPKCITHTMLGAWKRGVGSPTRAGVALPPLPPRHAVAPTGTAHTGASQLSPCHPDSQSASTAAINVNHEGGEDPGLQLPICRCCSRRHHVAAVAACHPARKRPALAPGTHAAATAPLFMLP